MEAVGIASIFVFTKHMASHPRRVESNSVNFVTSFPRKGSPINYGNFYFRMKLY